MSKKGRSKEEEEQIEQLRETFRMFDIDGDGTITLVEMKETLRNLGHNPTEKQLMDMIKDVDIDGDHEIDFDEFCTLMQRSFQKNKSSSSSKHRGKHEDERTRELRAAFRTFDTDGSGSISKKELKKLMRKLNQNLSEEELNVMMDVCDADGNGEIDFDEFKAMMT